MTEIHIIPSEERYAEGLNRALDLVARERRYIGFLEAPPLDGTLSHLRNILAGDGVQMLAVTQTDDVVGWCDIFRNRLEGFRHAGRLGIALLPAYRGKGLGRQLMTETLSAARHIGIERVELEVFASNTGAINLYRQLGFVVEGTKKRARKLDGEYDDDVLMALFLNS